MINTYLTIFPTLIARINKGIVFSSLLFKNKVLIKAASVATTITTSNLFFFGHIFVKIQLLLKFYFFS